MENKSRAGPGTAAKSPLQDMPPVSRGHASKAMLPAGPLTLVALSLPKEFSPNEQRERRRHFAVLHEGSLFALPSAEN